MSKKKFKPGDKIMIKVNGKEVETIITDDGVQRFPSNRIISYLTRGNDSFGLNKLWEFVGHGMFSMDDARLIYQNNGYSVCGYQEVFENDKIENPLWEK